MYWKSSSRTQPFRSAPEKAPNVASAKAANMPQREAGHPRLAADVSAGRGATARALFTMGRILNRFRLERGRDRAGPDAPPFGAPPRHGAVRFASRHRADVAAALKPTRLPACRAGFLHGASPHARRHG